MKLLYLIFIVGLAALTLGEESQEDPISPMQQLEDTIMIGNEKRAWKDFSKSWGKRAWGDLQTGWGKRYFDEYQTADWDKNDNKKRAWSNLHSSGWGKRAWSDLQSTGWGKRGWSDLQSAGWGKRGWSDLQSTGWGKKAWSDLQTSGWGKRSWSDLQSSGWGKRSKHEDDEDKEMEKKSWDSLHGGWGKRAADWGSFRGSWGKRDPAWQNLKGLWGKRSLPHSESFEPGLNNLEEEIRRTL
ncbi:unnamed protein product [Nezara viridula]|uniref:Neuropeptide n=1 Tax=Nezara viridula TaxID=85310 RepID=A0A3S5HJS2_NEZVI|nr:neuropeptide precursor [Nezara viridula]CAH1392841.1 unnamed protein product [Nezara viridula]